MIAMLFSLVTVPVAQVQESPDFSGTWETTYGQMILTQEGDEVLGWYDYGGISPIEGSIDERGRLVFTYREPETSGTGWFVLAEDGLSFSGRWSPDDDPGWYSWEGYRYGGEARTWLIVLESEWQESLSEGEYSFGEMLNAWFDRLPSVEVRHRFVHDTEDIRIFCLEAAMLPGSVYLVFASHGTADGLDLSGETVGPALIVEAVSPMTNLALIHFSCCEVMAGRAPGAILGSRSTWPDGFVVSGYTHSVDWGASAIIEFYYLNMILENGLVPEEAARAVLSDIGFAGESATRWMDAAGFKAEAP
jgi:hypothetical protein